VIGKGGVAVPGEASIQVVCACGKKLKAPATSVGKKARCPACGAIMILSANATARTADAASTAASAAAPGRTSAGRTVSQPSPSPATVPEDDDGLGALYDLAEQAKATPTPTAAARCPKCKSAMDDGAVLCTNCGYDTRTGKALSSAPLAKQPSAVAGGNKAKPVDLMAPQGSFVAGLAMSAAFALAASVLWFVVAWATGYAFGYIAILIGGAAGAGMKIGQKGFSSAGGAVAAGMTLAAILIAKLALVEFIMLPIATHNDPHASIFNLNTAALAYFFFKPISLIIMLIGMGAAFRTANGSISG
jgi:DNA-directed RNA polymerase subunit M/transcription elongation factor TFIIS